MHPVDTAASLSPWEPGILSLALFGLLALALVGLLLILCGWLGGSRPAAEKGRAYESGIIPSGTARLLHPVPFYRVAIFFLLFDLEGVFIFAWASAFRDLGWVGWLQMTFFIGVLLMGLAHIWCKGGLAWGEERRRRRTAG
jgi:NADH-quinone oxidoreductase subunit A